MIDAVISEVKKFYRRISGSYNGKFVSFQIELPEKKTYAVDGGSAIVYDGGSWCVSKIKTVAVCYEKEKKISEDTDVFYAVSRKENQKVKSVIVPSNEYFESKNLEETHNDIRCFLERKKIQKILENNKESIVLVDGARNKIQGNVICISKTSRTISPGGRSLVGEVNEIGSSKIKESPWLLNIGNGEFIVKFHPGSRFCYRVTSTKPELFGICSYYSSDPEIIGYPYPLIKADKIARIRKDEIKTDRFKIKTEARKSEINLDYDETSSIMHEILDERMYR